MLTSRAVSLGMAARRSGGRPSVRLPSLPRPSLRLPRPSPAKAKLPSSCQGCQGDVAVPARPDHWRQPAPRGHQRLAEFRAAQGPSRRAAIPATCGTTTWPTGC
jgi:hypothetical protein